MKEEGEGRERKRVENVEREMFRGGERIGEEEGGGGRKREEER